MESSIGKLLLDADRFPTGSVIRVKEGYGVPVGQPDWLVAPWWGPIRRGMVYGYYPMELKDVVPRGKVEQVLRPAQRRFFRYCLRGGMVCFVTHFLDKKRTKIRVTQIGSEVNNTKMTSMRLIKLDEWRELVVERDQFNLKLIQEFLIAGIRCDKVRASAQNYSNNAAERAQQVNA